MRRNEPGKKEANRREGGKTKSRKSLRFCFPLVSRMCFFSYSCAFFFFPNVTDFGIGDGGRRGRCPAGKRKEVQFLAVAVNCGR